MDVIYNLLHVKRFFNYTIEEKIELKKRGRPLPDIVIENVGCSRGKPYKRQFNKEIYLRNNWICGCNRKNALFCFPCVLFVGDKSWTKVGVTDLVHLADKIKRHDCSKLHLQNTMDLALLGTTNMKEHLDSAYWLNVQKHNENVIKNRHILSKIIDCIKFCEAFELAQRGLDEISQNPGIFRGLINFSAELDATLSEHPEISSIFKGTISEIQNDLLDCILKVCHEEIIKEINKSSFLALMAHETTDVCAEAQLAIILRYTIHGELIERFWKYINPTTCDVETLSEHILSIVNPLVENSPFKLISQSYDGGAVMSGQHGGVQVKIKQKYPCAHFVHCYAHELNVIISKVASIDSQVRVFFGNLKDIPAFFKNRPQQVQVLDIIVKRKNPQTPTTHWNFNIQTINVVFENMDSLIECMEEIEEQYNNETVCSAASSIRRMLQDSVFVFWLTFFHHVMPHVDSLCNWLQKEKTSLFQVNHAIDNFEKSINHIRNNIDNIIIEAFSNICAEPHEKKTKYAHKSRFNYHTVALEVCECIVNCVQDRFMFKDHLQAASLFFSEWFEEYSADKFPNDKLSDTSLAYPMIDKMRLKLELSVIYSRSDCRHLSGVLPLLRLITLNKLDDTFRETKKLLEIVATTPVPTSETERCFSTLKRIKTFLQNSMSQDRLTALTMLSIERLFISKIENFNEKVIDRFASMKDRKIELTFKKSECYQTSTEESAFCNFMRRLPAFSKENGQYENIYITGKSNKQKNNCSIKPARGGSQNGYEQAVRNIEETNMILESINVNSESISNTNNGLAENKTSEESNAINLATNAVVLLVPNQENKNASPILHLDFKEEPTRLVENEDVPSYVTVKTEKIQESTINDEPQWEGCGITVVDVNVKEEPRNDRDFGLEMDVEEGL